MKLVAGGKPWRRKPSAAPAMIAARTPATLRSSERAITDSVAALIRQTPAARPSTPSIRLTTLAIATMPSTVPRSPRSTWPSSGSSKSSVEPGSTPPTNGSVKTSTVTPAETGIAAATICPTSFAPGGRSMMSSTMPTSEMTTAPSRIARVCSSQGR